ncbi:ABC transporter permease [Paenibacillus sp. 1001270B_150601_E10]|uniref:ABC transporter permease n=1 Tax=Paenibacillus sp. 1001270B_150601_E10 TaxID=2787079 RepID=UPI00189DD376|nr:ABC-2 family transporter protein [Paenibacillus sp. 1001270B_150601_E10]
MLKKKYVTLAKMTMQHTIAYRFSYFISLLGSLIFILTMFFMWKAIFDGREELSGFTWPQMKAYIFITFLTNSLISWYSETRISKKILSGEVAMDLLKPLDFQKARAAETIGSSLMEGAIAAIMIGVTLVLAGGIMLPESSLTLALFIISLLASLLIKFCIVYIVGLICFWTSNSIGVAWMRAAVTNFLSGAIIPLSFFPAWLEFLARVLPFQGIVYIPASIYLERMSTIEAVQGIGMQLIWIIVLWIAAKGMWNWAVRQVTIYGG